MQKVYENSKSTLIKSLQLFLIISQIESIRFEIFWYNYISYSNGRIILENNDTHN